MTHSSHRADEPVSLPTNGDTCVCKFRDAMVCILSDGQHTSTGTAMVCAPGSDGRNRWKAAS
ncbi:hypothetical protein JWS13_02220 (plasmid) [Rhodococcus pseudokoreensis]|uniref:Uncharacterized protein n=1 Tax=Rhodococcus pseudokoreensis TaxID=2811421 RepID=A0A974VYI5_9NOCA|nr:hypothetical protein [Rhodococcus pseudokoreensis]QSE87457.1 hypothetical protein JWS13_02220 [Rhodococcus pseudokoreensis]